MLCTIFLAEEEIVRKFDVARLARTPRKANITRDQGLMSRNRKCRDFSTRVRKSGRSSNGHFALLWVKDYRFR
jgi:hypothetical protein